MRPIKLALAVLVVSLFSVTRGASNRCSRYRNGRESFIWGDILDDPSCLGPNGAKYPRALVSRIVSNLAPPNFRTGRYRNSDPLETKQLLFNAYQRSNGMFPSDRKGRTDVNMNEISQCTALPDRLCKTEYNTTVPMYGISLTSGEPVTIVQKFPNLLQQVVYEECLSNKCDLINGECVQTYVPQLFFVVPMGPVTLMGQDYVMVESGCICRPKL